LTTAVIPLRPKSWVQPPLFNGTDRGKGVPHGSVVSISEDPAREADAIIRLILSQKQPKMPPSANAAEMAPSSPEARSVTRRGLALQIFDSRRKPKRADAPSCDKAVAADATTASDGKKPK